MKKLLDHMNDHIIKHKHKYLGLAVFAKFVIIGLFVSMMINVVQKNNIHAQTILPLSSDMCNVYDDFAQSNWMDVKIATDRLIDEGICSIENFPYLFFFAAVADYNMGNQVSAVENINYMLAFQGLANVTPQDFMVGVAALDPLITSGGMAGLESLDGFTYYQGIYSICSDTVDIPTDTSNSTYIEDAFILKSYQEDVGALSIVSTGTYVGKAPINTSNSSGEIIQKFALQSSGYSNEIEIVGPENLQVFEDDEGTTPLKGIINNPTLLENSVADELSNVITVMEWTNNQDVPMFFKDKTSGEPVDVTMNIPVTGTVGDSIVAYYSNDDGSTWNFTTQTTISEINNTPYAVILSKHATIFAIIEGGTGLFVINNDDVTTTGADVVLTIDVPEGKNMRFSNDNTIRSDWETYTGEKDWILSEGEETNTVYAQFDLDNDTGTIEIDTNDTITYEVETVEEVVVVAPSGGGGGGGGSAMTKDVCYDGDCSESYYDGVCGVCPTVPEENTEEVIVDTTHNAADVQGDINGSTYSDEINSAYLWSYNLGITTIPTIQEANINGKLKRSQLAKMLVNYADKLLDLPINTGAKCLFTDLGNQTKETQYYAILSCQLGLMGLKSDGAPNTLFNPKGEVTRAQFGTTLSRLLYDGKYNTKQESQRYVRHLNALKKNNIITKIDQPNASELRGRVMIMLQRAAGK